MSERQLEHILGRRRAYGKLRPIQLADLAQQYEDDGFPMAEPDRTNMLVMVKKTPKRPIYLRIRGDLPEIDREGKVVLPGVEPRSAENPEGVPLVVDFMTILHPTRRVDVPMQQLDFVPGDARNVTFDHAVWLLDHPHWGSILEEVGDDEVRELNARMFKRQGAANVAEELLERAKAGDADAKTVLAKILDEAQKANALEQKPKSKPSGKRGK